MQLQILNAELGRIRRERMNGRDYLVAPFVSLGPRVLNGSKGALYYPRDEIEANPGVWNYVPITLGHPVDPTTNLPISARDPEVLNRVQLGHIFKDRTDSGWRKGEAWFDERMTRAKAPEVHEALIQNRPLELSTGLYTDNEESQGMTDNGQPYDYIARNYRPDHLAILPNQIGACSNRDGCGINLNQKRGPAMTMPKSFWHRLGEAFGMIFNDETPTDGHPTPNQPTSQPRHGETGEYLPRGAKLGKKQFQTAADRGFEHLSGTEQAPPNDIDDDGDRDTPEFGEAGGRVGPGMEMDHIPLPTDRGPRTATGNKKHKFEMGNEGEDDEDEVDNEGMPAPLPARADTIDQPHDTGMTGSPLHVGPTGNRTMKTKFYVTNSGPFPDMSHGDIKDHVQGQLQAKTSQDKPSPMIHEVHDDHVIYHDGDGHKKQDIAPDDDGKPKLTGKPVPVKPVTKFQPVSNQEHPMTAQQREQAVGWLTVNCQCWKGKKAVLQNKEAFSDDDIKTLVENVIVGRKNATMVANAKKAGIVLNEKADSSSADQTATTEVDSNDSKNKNEEEDELPMFKKKDIKGKATINAEQADAISMALFGQPVARVKEVMGGGLAANNQRKGQLLALLTQNHRDPATKKQAAETLNQLSVEQLELLARGLPPMMQPAVNLHRIGQQTQQRTQQAPPVFGPEIDAEVLNERETLTDNAGPDILPMPRMMWGNQQTNNAKQRA